MIPCPNLYTLVGENAFEFKVWVDNHIVHFYRDANIHTHPIVNFT